MKLEKLTKEKSAYQVPAVSIPKSAVSIPISEISIPGICNQHTYKVHYNVWCDGEPAEIIPPGQVNDLSEATANMQPRLKRPGRDNRKRSTGREKPVSEITGSSTRPHGQSSTSGVLDGTKHEGAVPW